MIKSLKKMDLIIALFLILFSIVMLCFQSVNSAAEVMIEVDGELYASYDINIDREVVIRTKYGENIVVIENGSVFVVESSCKDKLEITAGSINKTGQSLVCLPNRLVISLKGDLNTVVNTY